MSVNGPELKCQQTDNKVMMMDDLSVNQSYRVDDLLLMNV